MQFEKKDQFSTFSSALLEVLTNQKYLWNEARSFNTVARIAQREDREDIPPRRAKDDTDGSPGSGKKSRAARRRQAQKVKVTMLKKEVSNYGKDTRTAGGGKGSTGKGAVVKITIPEREWKILMSFPKKSPEVCRFFNSSLNCKFGSGCRQVHKCAQCSGDHSWFSQHSRE